MLRYYGAFQVYSLNKAFLILLGKEKERERILEEGLLVFLSMIPLRISAYGLHVSSDNRDASMDMIPSIT